MWDLEQYGLAKRFNVAGKWMVTFDGRVDDADKPIAPVSVRPQ